MRLGRTTLLVSGVALLTVTGGSSIALATPGSGTSSTPPVFGALHGPVKAKQDRIELRTRDDSTVASFTLTYAVGAQSGWHRHPGIVIAVVESGTVTRQVGCTTETFTAGQAFTEVEPHLVRNAYSDAADPQAVPAVLRITQIVPADAPARRIEVDPPSC